MQLPIKLVVQNVNERLTRVEQILPTLATKTDLDAAIAPLATKAELAAAVAPLATKAELAAAIANAIVPLATKAQMREEGERTRRHFDAVAERLESHIRLLAEGQMSLREHMDSRFEHVEAQITGLDRRVMRLEGARP